MTELQVWSYRVIHSQSGRLSEGGRRNLAEFAERPDLINSPDKLIDAAYAQIRLQELTKRLTK